MHVPKALVDLRERTVVRDVLVDLHLSLHVVCRKRQSQSQRKGRCATRSLRTFYEARDLRAALDAAERTSTPSATSHELEADSHQFR